MTQDKNTMLNLKEWKDWFVRKGYDSVVSEDGSTLVITLKTCSISLQADGVVTISGFVDVQTKTGLWSLINTLGVIK